LFVKPSVGLDTNVPYLATTLRSILWLIYSKENVASNIDYKHENSKVMRHSLREADSRLAGQET